MRKWQFDILFAVFVLGAIFLLFAKSLGFTIEPTALTGYGAVTTYVLTQRTQWTKKQEADSAASSPSPDPPAKDEAPGDS